MSELLKLQQEFLPCVAKLISFAYANGYKLTAGETWRTADQVALDVQEGKGIANSLHPKRLAMDLNLFRDGILLVTHEGYKPLGDYWKTLHPLARWGGDFPKPDSDHFSLTFEGTK